MTQQIKQECLPNLKVLINQFHILTLLWLKISGNLLTFLNWLLLLLLRLDGSSCSVVSLLLTIWVYSLDDFIHLVCELTVVHFWNFFPEFLVAVWGWGLRLPGYLGLFLINSKQVYDCFLFLELGRKLLGRRGYSLFLYRQMWEITSKVKRRLLSNRLVNSLWYWNLLSLLQAYWWLVNRSLSIGIRILAKVEKVDRLGVISCLGCC